MGKSSWINHLTLITWKCEMPAMLLVNITYSKNDAGRTGVNHTYPVETHREALWLP